MNSRGQQLTLLPLDTLANKPDSDFEFDFSLCHGYILPKRTQGVLYSASLAESSQGSQMPAFANSFLCESGVHPSCWHC